MNRTNRPTSHESRMTGRGQNGKRPTPPWRNFTGIFALILIIVLSLTSIANVATAMGYKDFDEERNGRIDPIHEQEFNVTLKGFVYDIFTDEPIEGAEILLESVFYYDHDDWDFDYNDSWDDWDYDYNDTWDDWDDDYNDSWDDWDYDYNDSWDDWDDDYNDSWDDWDYDYNDSWDDWDDWDYDYNDSWDDFNFSFDNGTIDWDMIIDIIMDIIDGGCIPNGTDVHMTDSFYTTTDEDGFFEFVLPDYMEDMDVMLFIEADGYYERFEEIYLEDENYIEAYIEPYEHDEGDKEYEYEYEYIDENSDGNPEYIYIYELVMMDGEVVYEYEYEYVDENDDGNPEYEYEYESSKFPGEDEDHDDCDDDDCFKDDDIWFEDDEYYDDVKFDEKEDKDERESEISLDEESDDGDGDKEDLGVSGENALAIAPTAGNAVFAVVAIGIGIVAMVGIVISRERRRIRF